MAQKHRMRRRKCIARGKSTYWCDGCNTNSTKCPYRDKYRDLRNTKYGREKYGYYFQTGCDKYTNE